jgi:ATP-binding cassette subfamily F protein 3
LVLDEPTNHLDMETREALTMALSSYEGALLLVSHDRHLLRAATDQLWLVHEGQLSEFDGDLDQYTALVLASRRERAETDASDEPAKEPVRRREERRREAQERGRQTQAKKPLEQRQKKLEREIETRTAELKALDLRLADPDFYHAGDTADVAQLLKQRAQLSEKLEALEAQWLQGQEELERTA